MAQQHRIEALEREVAELKARLKKDSSNSSKPPSSDPPWKDPAERRQPGKRKQGGQPGHKGHERRLVEPSEVIELRPSECAHCGEELEGTDASPSVHQVSEVPEVVARVTEYRLHSLCCSSCDRRTVATLPTDASQGAFGPRLQAIIALCTGRFHLSKRATEELLEDVFGVQISLGAICNVEHAMSGLLKAPAEEALASLHTAKVVHADETSWAERNRRAWLWVGVTSKAAAFLVRPRRDTQAAQELLGRNFPGALVTDQFPGYLWVPAARRQLCWAHLIRHFRGLLDYDGEVKEIGQSLLDETEKVFDEWHRLRREYRRRDLPSALQPIRERIASLLRRGAASGHKQLRAMSKGLLEFEGSLWTFAHRVGVEPTNNAAERALRSAVLWRKSSFGTQGDRGSRFVERILTVVTTLRIQGRNVLDFLTQACRNAMVGEAPPRLIGG